MLRRRGSAVVSTHPCYPGITRSGVALEIMDRIEAIEQRVTELEQRLAEVEQRQEDASASPIPGRLQLVRPVPYGANDTTSREVWLGQRRRGNASITETRELGPVRTP